jgi:hypothetical protein
LVGRLGGGTKTGGGAAVVAIADAFVGGVSIAALAVDADGSGAAAAEDASDDALVGTALGTSEGTALAVTAGEALALSVDCGAAAADTVGAGSTTGAAVTAGGAAVSAGTASVTTGWRGRKITTPTITPTMATNRSPPTAATMMPADPLLGAVGATGESAGG